MMFDSKLKRKSIMAAGALSHPSRIMSKNPTKKTLETLSSNQLTHDTLQNRKCKPNHLSSYNSKKKPVVKSRNPQLKEEEYSDHGGVGDPQYLFTTSDEQDTFNEEL